MSKKLMAYEKLWAVIVSIQEVLLNSFIHESFNELHQKNFIHAQREFSIQSRIYKLFL